MSWSRFHQAYNKALVDTKIPSLNLFFYPDAVDWFHRKTTVLTLQSLGWNEEIAKAAADSCGGSAKSRLTVLIKPDSNCRQVH